MWEEVGFMASFKGLPFGILKIKMPKAMCFKNIYFDYFIIPRNLGIWELLKNSLLPPVTVFSF